MSYNSTAGSFLDRIRFELDNFFISEKICCLVRMRNRELNRDQNLIGGQMAVQNWTEINAWTALVQRNLRLN